MNDIKDTYDLEEPLRAEFTEEGREEEELSPPEELPEEEMAAEPGEGLTEERGFSCVCPQCGFEHPAVMGADCAEIKCPECGLSMQPR